MSHPSKSSFLLAFAATTLIASHGMALAQATATPTANKPTATQPAAPKQPAKVGTDGRKWVYPSAATGNQVDTYHGVDVKDPYRWLEDPDTPQAREWIDAQNKITYPYLESIPEHKALRERLEKLWNFERYSTPSKDGGKYFFSKNDGLQNQSVLYVADSLTAEPRVLLDPNTLSKDGTIALAGTSVSEDGKLLAYGIAEAGSDWNTWKVRDVATGKDLADTLNWVKFSGAAFTKDGKGFFYSRYDEPKAAEQLTGANYFQKLYYHEIGTDQSADTLIYERKDHKEWGFGGGVTEDGKYFIIYVSEGTDPKNRFFFAPMPANPRDLAGGKGVVELIPEPDASYEFVGNEGSVFWMKTDLNAPKGRLIAIDTANPDRKGWKEVIPQSNETLQGVSLVGDQFFVSYLKNATTQVKSIDLTGKLIREVKLPDLGTAGGFGGRRSDNETFYSFTSFNRPASIYRYDVKTGESSVFKAPRVDFKSDDFVTEQVFFTSKDGTKIPMFIVHKKGIKKDGSNPTLLYGYGGFNISLTPSFSVSNAVWLERGGIYAMPNLRGGGEFGEEWHQAGTKTRKQNVFDDFIGAAEYLIKEGYTSSPKLAIQGGSNGGLLVGAAIVQRPELFGAAIPAVGVLDMLRFNKFTIGWAWESDYGSPANADEFKALYAYSPYHNLKAGAKYPSTLIVTADHDDRVVPAHSFKFAAALQAAQAGDRPTLIRIESRAGHGAGKPTSKRIEEAADQLAFLTRELK